VQWHSEGNSSLEVRLGVKGAVSVNVDHDLAGAVAKRCYVSRSVWGHLFSSESSRPSPSYQEAPSTTYYDRTPSVPSRINYFRVKFRRSAS